MENIVKNENRRDFLKASGTVAGGLVLGFYLPSGPRIARAAEGAGSSPNAWVRIAPDNTVTIMVARSEMGQDVYTSMAMLFAEELEVDINKVKVEFAPPAEVYANALFGAQITGGSTSVREAWERQRKVGASARMMLVAAAADNWGVAAGRCKAIDGIVTGPGNQRATYGSLAAKAAEMEVPKEVPLKPANEFKIIGNVRQKRLDTPAKVRATAQFGIDTRIPGMAYAAVVMPPMIGGKVASYDDTRARNFPGVKTVVEFSGGVAVVANDYWTASKAVATLDVHWEGGPLSNSDQRSIWDGLESASQKPGAVFREHGDADAGMANAAKTVTAEYRLPFLSHSPMEPMNTTADVRADKAIIITPTQFQQLVPHVVAGVTGLKPEQVEVQTTFLGGGFGRRLEMDFVIAAAEISKAAGMPVKMVWSREEDMTHDAYRPAAILKFKAGLDSKGNLSAVQFHSTSPSITARMFPAFVKDGIDPFALEAIDNFPYAADAGLRFAYQMHDTGVKVGYWRAVSHNVNALAVESFMDELATTAGRDPLQYRMDMLDMTSTKHQWSGNAAGVAVGPRMRRALAQVQKKSGWGKNMPAGRGQGVAVMEGYNTVIAMVAEVTVSDTYDVQIDKITAVVDAGTLIHPDQALAQMQSCINFGQAACMYGEITFKDGTVQQDNFDTFRVTRINEAPKTLNIHFIKSNTTPGGLGEPGTAVVQPAIANAIFAATGKRVRTSPFTPENISAA